MIKTSYLFFILATVITVNAAFRCERGVSECSSYTQDTVKFDFRAANNTGAFHVNDTIQLFSQVNDSILTVKGKSFVSNIGSLTTNIQTYKLVFSNNLPELNYANIEFNPVLYEGFFYNYPGSGLNFLYNRIAPYNRLRAGMVAGRPGLYIAVILPYSNNYTFETGNYCTSYSNLFFVPEAQRRQQYWASLGTSTLRLAGGNGYEITNARATNYFFIEVLP